MKYYVYANNVTDYAQGLNRFLTLSTEDTHAGNGWALIGTAEVDITVTAADVTKTAVEDIEKQIEEIRARREASINELTNIKNQLLAIEHVA